MAALEHFSHSTSLFITDLGPMRFYVRPGPLKRQLSPLITHGGGIMCRVQEPGAFLLTEPGQVQGIQYMSSTYITDCVRSNRRLSPRTYRLLNRATVGMGQTRVTERAPCEINRVERRNTFPEIIPTGQGLNTGALGENGGLVEADSALCDQSSNTAISRGQIHTALESNLAGSSYVSITRAPASCDFRETTCAPVISDISHCAEPLVLGDPSSEVPAPLDSCPSSKASVLANPSLLDPDVCDPTPIIGVSVMNDMFTTDADQMVDSRGGKSSVNSTTSDKELDNIRVVEEEWARLGEALEHQDVPGPVLTAPGPVGRLPFTRQEDIAILLYVKENEAPKRSVTGTLLWKELEKKQLLRRTWQAMKCRYTKYIVRHKHQYKLPKGGLVHVTSKTANVESSGDITNQHRDPSCAGTNTDSISQFHDLPSAESSLKSLCVYEDSPHTVNMGGLDIREGVVTDDDDDGSTVIRRVRSANRIITELTPEPLQENCDSSSEAKGNRVSMATSTQLSISQGNQDTENSGDLQIFEIANMEFEEADEHSGCKVKAPGISLKEFVMGEDSVSTDTQMQVDDVTSSPDLSDSEGLQVALIDMMSEFKLDICQVTQALLKNNGEVGSTRQFLRIGRRPDGFPIWEHEDDVDLQSNDPMVQAQLARKYGADNVAKRAAFLAS